MTDAPDREAIIDAVARARPWRTPSYLVLYFLRRWAVLLFTLSIMLATRQHWAVAAIAIAGALLFDLKITPKSVDLRLDDREFVRKIYDLEVFEAELTRKSGKAFKAIVMLIFCISLLTIIGRILINYDNVIALNKLMLELIYWSSALFCIAFLSRYSPLSDTPNTRLYNEKQITIYSWKKHGYYVSAGFTSMPLALNMLLILFCITLNIIGCTIFATAQESTINDAVMFWYSIIAGALGFLVPIIMNINAKGQRIARYLLNTLQGDQAS